jgi:hypothetical protein
VLPAWLGRKDGEIKEEESLKEIDKKSEMVQYWEQCNKTSQDSNLQFHPGLTISIKVGVMPGWLEYLNCKQGLECLPESNTLAYCSKRLTHIWIFLKHIAGGPISKDFLCP